MYRKPKNLDPRITDELYEKLSDIAKIEACSAISFGMFDVCFERAVVAAATETLNASEQIQIAQAVEVAVTHYPWKDVLLGTPQCWCGFKLPEKSPAIKDAFAAHIEETLRALLTVAAQTPEEKGEKEEK